ncbi:putative Endochitinase EP3 [Hypsibius exemplaris]|uniref:Endochitinase EP3 n=1 Tax=Hypsibius exemplaris TaxID=2072580 RepID=A0A9X6NJA8_HYPEX|nr:putative Endochitinase EP3 [Hypsibius exemplaris]
MLENLPYGLKANSAILYQDKAPCLTAGTVQAFLEEEMPCFIRNADIPPNSPDRNPFDYFMWSLRKERANKHGLISSFDRLTKKLKDEWEPVQFGNTSRPGSPPTGGEHGHGSPFTMGDESISKTEFDQAFTSNGFDAPPTAYYNAFISPRVKNLAGITSKRELAMFLANVIHETGGLKYLEEINGHESCKKGKYRDVWGSNPAEPNKNKCYHGRGPIQLTYPQNYHDASLAIFKDAATLIDNPERVLTDKQTGWETAAWYWGSRVGNQPGVKEGQFGSSINAINGAEECRGQNQDKAAKRKEYYANIFRLWRISGQVDLSGC